MILLPFVQISAFKLVCAWILALWNVSSRRYTERTVRGDVLSRSPSHQVLLNGARFCFRMFGCRVVSISMRFDEFVDFVGSSPGDGPGTGLL